MLLNYNVSEIERTQANQTVVSNFLLKKKENFIFRMNTKISII